MLLKIALLAVLRQKKSATKNDNNPGTEKKRERSEEVKPHKAAPSQKGPLYGASRESRVGIATLKEPVTQNRRKKKLLLRAIVIF